MCFKSDLSGAQNDTTVNCTRDLQFTDKGNLFHKGETGTVQLNPTESPRDGASAWLSAPAASTAISEMLSMGHRVFV